MVKIGLRSLVVSAGVALVLLTISSDLVPAHVDGFADAISDGQVLVVCVVVQCNRSKTGLIVDAVDQNGLEASIYLQPSVLSDPIPIGSVVRLDVTPSDTDPTFMFASSCEVLSFPVGTS
jgi:hypothetical protein